MGEVGEVVEVLFWKLSLSLSLTLLGMGVVILVTESF